MINWASWAAFFLVVFTCPAAAQFPGGGVRPTSITSPMSAFDPTQLDLWMMNHEAEKRHRQLESPSDSVSKLDLKAPGSARRAYEKGLQLLMRKNFNGAVEHLTKSASIYPKYVAAHSALGSAYLDLGKNDQAREEFAQAVLLDDHLPNSYLNLGRVELALQHYPAAEESMKKASAIAPLDLHLLTALTYAQFLNHDLEGAIATVHQVHGRKHEGAAIVHYFAAAAWQRQSNLQETQHELQTLLEEDPKSPAVEQARLMLERIEEQGRQPAAPALAISYEAAPGQVSATPGELPLQFKRKMQELQEQKQVAEAELESTCETCGPPGLSGPRETDVSRGSVRLPERHSPGYAGWTLHSSADEVALFFAATDRGKPARDLTQRDVGIRDDRKPPAAIVGFRNESQLPLRLGLVIDSSASITNRFSFEQGAAANFLHKVVTDENDLVFVVGFANSVLLVQDFTSDEKNISHGVGQLAPAGGTAAWDAVAFAADKLASKREERPVARILVVISDGDDNSSSATLKQAIESALRGEVIVYTVSTREESSGDESALVGDRALKLLAERTGGVAFFPGSLGHLNHSLEELQQVIRSRYLISYKPALFRHDGQYRTVDITAQRAGRKLRVYARRGYYATRESAHEGDF
jgi:Ca-activated chloride channel family protein